MRRRPNRDFFNLFRQAEFTDPERRLLTRLIVQGIVVLSRSNLSGNNVLFQAILNDNIAAVRYILNWDAELAVMKRESDLQLPLHTAAQVGNIHIVEELLKHMENINCMDAGNNTPLYWALVGNHPGVAEYLLSRGGYVTTVPRAISVDNMNMMASQVMRRAYGGRSDQEVIVKLLTYRLVVEGLIKSITRDCFYYTLQFLYPKRLKDLLESCKDIQYYFSYEGDDRVVKLRGELPRLDGYYQASHIEIRNILLYGLYNREIDSPGFCVMNFEMRSVRHLVRGVTSFEERMSKLELI